MVCKYISEEMYEKRSNAINLIFQKRKTRFPKMKDDKIIAPRNTELRSPQSVV